MRAYLLVLFAASSCSDFLSSDDPQSLTQPTSYFQLRTVDKETQAPLCSVLLQTTNNVLYYSDLNGNVAFYEPGLMSSRVWFFVSKAGYSVPLDGLGQAGVALDTVPGSVATVELTRNPTTTAAAPSGGDRDTVLLQEGVPAKDRYFKIKIVDRATQRGVPLIEVKSLAGVSVTDSHGVVAFYAPGFMGTTVRFQIYAHGYSFPSGFVDLSAQSGGGAELQVDRVHAAQRLYRITGQGIYRDSVLLEEAVPTVNPVMNAGVMGQDTVSTAIYNGKLFWVWGDTEIAGYALGSFHGTSATSALSGLDPNLGVNLDYLKTAAGAVKAIAPVAGPGPTWLSSLVSLPNAFGKDVLYGRFYKPSNGQLGMVRFNDTTQVFERMVSSSGGDPWPPESGHPFRARVDGNDYLYSGPVHRVLPTAERYPVSAEVESYTAYAEGSSTALVRDSDGDLEFSWKRNTPMLTLADANQGKIKANEYFFSQVQDPEVGAPILTAGVDLGWNPYRKRYTWIVNQRYGSPSFLGEVWYAEGDTPMGPWVYGRKVVSHYDYSFYNVAQHPYFMKQNGKEIFFEGTYTKIFSHTFFGTPRYDYNQVMYKLDLDDERVNLPVAIYNYSQDDIPDKLGKKTDLPSTIERALPVPFFAYEREKAGTIPIYAIPRANGKINLTRQGSGTPLFYALPPTTSTPAPTTVVPLYEYVHALYPNTRAYSTDANWVKRSFSRVAEPVCWVWKNPLKLKFHVGKYLPRPDGTCCKN